MLAFAEPAPTPSTVPNVQEIGIDYDPTKTLTSRFEFSTADGKNRLVIEDDTELRFRLTGGLFAALPVLWSVAPLPGGAPPVIIQEDETTIKFLVPLPENYYSPWSFRLNIDAGGVRGITSPSFFIVRGPLDMDDQNRYSETCDLVYHQNGSLTLDNAFTLGREVALFNTIYPFVIRINLSAENSGQAVSFSSSGGAGDATPVVWNSGRTPGWVSCVNYDSNVLEIEIAEEALAAGNAEGFSLMLEVDGVQVLSPDPILINATLGDG